MQKLLLVTSLLCSAIFALQAKASEQQQKTVDVQARVLEGPFIGQSGMVIPGMSLSGFNLKVPVQEGHYPILYPAQAYGDITDHLERCFPGSEAITFNMENHDDYFADVYMNAKLPYEAQVRRLQTREFAHLLSLATIYQAVKQAYKPEKQ